MSKELMDANLKKYGGTLLEALDRTIAAEKYRSIAYRRGILRKWSKAGVKTAEDIENYERNFREEQSRKKHRKQPSEEKKGNEFKQKLKVMRKQHEEKQKPPWIKV